MENFEYEKHESQSSGGRKVILIIFVIILLGAAFFMGVLSRDYFNILPDKDINNSIEVVPDENEETTVLEATATPEATQQLNELPPVIIQQPSVADIPSIVETVTQGVVSITTYYSSSSKNVNEWEPMAYGTGVIISSDGYIVTNNHVIEGAALLTATLSTGEKITAEVIGSDQYVDIAVIKINKDNLYTIPFGDSSLSRPGEQVIAIGSPLGDELTGTVTSGIISAVDRQLEIDGIPFTLLQTDAAINPGNSGGPLVNMNGEVIGINTLKSIFAGYDEYGAAIAAEGISYAIPSNSVQDSINDILEYGGVVRPFIGVRGSDTSYLIQQDSDLSLPDGFMVTEVVSGSPAETAGIMPEDIIIGIEGKTVTGFTDLYTIINSHEIGDTIIFKIYRYNTDEELELEVKLASNQDFTD